MANDFDPDAFLKGAAAPTAAFDPDAFLRGEGTPKETNLPSTTDVLRYAARAIPLVGPSLAYDPMVGKAVQNIPKSAVQFGHDIAQPFIDPVGTFTNLKNLGHGVLQKLGMMSGTEAEPYAEAAGKFLTDRYGGVENIRKTLEEDPVGLAADLSMVLTGGGSAAARAPGMVGRLGEAASVAGRAVDPISAAVKGAELTGRGAAEVIGGLGTHTGAESLTTAAKAGYEGGAGARAFRENLRGAEPAEETVKAAQEAVANMRNKRGAIYRFEMAQNIHPEKTILSFNDIDTAVNEMERVKTYKGQSLSPSTEKIRDQMVGAIDEWKNLHASEYHTAEGFDALKQKLGDIRDATQPNTPERVVADQIYRAARNTIVKQVPEYAKIMEGYEEATKQIGSIERELSLKKMGNVDTALRKLQSTLRNNVNTNFGRRRELAQFLIDNGSPHLMERLAGQALNPAMPRGWGKLAAQVSLEGILGLLGVAHAGGVGIAAAAPIAASLPFMSPRLMGEAAYRTGQAAKVGRQIRPGILPSAEIGRLGEQDPRRAAFMRALLASQGGQ